MVKIICNIDTFRITKHLGSGQFGTVNEGVWTTGQEQRAVAMKLVTPSAAETEKVKLLREGATMGQFDHVNVVKLHGLVTVGEPVSHNEWYNEKLIFMFFLG